MQPNRRQFHRFSGEPSPCVVAMDSVQLGGALVDESIAGAGICGLDLLMIPFNKSLTVTHRDESFQAFARRVARQADGRINLGVVRNDADVDSTSSSAMLINCYVQLKDTLAICAPVAFEKDSRILIQLFDGMQFRVNRSQLISLTRKERFEMLGHERILEQAIEMYGLVDSAFGARHVFEYEFGTYDECPVLQLA